MRLRMTLNSRPPRRRNQPGPTASPSHPQSHARPMSAAAARRLVRPAGRITARPILRADHYSTPGWFDNWDFPRDCYMPVITCLGLRHSTTHGRNVGVGWPMVGTSWLNRPYYVGG